MAYITATANQVRFLRSLARDIGIGDAGLAVRIADVYQRERPEALAKSEASHLIDELLRERDAVTLREFRERGQVSTEG